MHVRDKARIVVLPQVHGKQLLLPEVFAAVEAGERLLSCVRAHVRLQAPLLGGKQGHAADTGWKRSSELPIISELSPLKSGVALIRVRACCVLGSSLATCGVLSQPGLQETCPQTKEKQTQILCGPHRRR